MWGNFASVFYDHSSCLLLFNVIPFQGSSSTNSCSVVAPAKLCKGFDEACNALCALNAFITMT